MSRALSDCRHTSQDAIGKPRDWPDKHPDMLPTQAFRYPADDAALAGAASQPSRSSASATPSRCRIQGVMG